MKRAVNFFWTEQNTLHGIAFDVSYVHLESCAVSWGSVMYTTYFIHGPAFHYSPETFCIYEMIWHKTALLYQKKPNFLWFSTTLWHTKVPQQQAPCLATAECALAGAKSAVALAYCTSGGGTREPITAIDCIGDGIRLALPSPMLPFH